MLRFISCNVSKHVNEPVLQMLLVSALYYGIKVPIMQHFTSCKRKCPAMSLTVIYA
jgi:hypothetical protein